jgi:hypothetical protein
LSADDGGSRVATKVTKEGHTKRSKDDEDGAEHAPDRKSGFVPSFVFFVLVVASLVPPVDYAGLIASASGESGQVGMGAAV